MTAPYLWVGGNRQAIPIKTEDAGDGTVALGVNASGVGDSDDKVLLLIGGNLSQVPLRCVSNEDTPRTYSLAVSLVGGGGSGSFITWRGEWDIDTDYVENDVVSYQGSSYLAVTDNTAIEPGTDPGVWGLIAQKGDTGAQGIQGDPGEQGIQGETGPAGPQNIPTSTAALPGIPTVGDADSGLYALVSGILGLSYDGVGRLETDVDGIDIIGRALVTANLNTSPAVDILQNHATGAGLRVTITSDLHDALYMTNVGGTWYGRFQQGKYLGGLASGTADIDGFYLDQNGIGGALRFALKRLNDAKAISVDLRDASGTGWRIRLDGGSTGLEFEQIGTGVRLTIDASGNITGAAKVLATTAGTASEISARKLGTGATDAAAGNDSRLSDARTPTGAAGGHLDGTYPNPTIRTTSLAKGRSSGFRGTGGAQSIATASDIRLPLTEVEDDDAYHSDVSNPSRIIIPSDLAGRYIISGFVQFNNPGASAVRWVVTIFKGASTVLGRFEAPAGTIANVFPAFNVPAIARLAVGDYIELGVYHEFGSSINTLSYALSLVFDGY